MSPRALLHLESHHPLFTVAMLGEPGVGKSALLARLAACPCVDAGRVVPHCVAADGDFAVAFSSSMGDMGFVVRECRRSEVGGPLHWGDGDANERLGDTPSALNGVQAVCLVCDVTSRESYRRVPPYYRDILEQLGSIPTVLLGNKADVPPPSAESATAIVFHRKKDFPYFAASAVTGKMCVPREMLRRWDSDDEDLGPAPLPPSIFDARRSVLGQRVPRSRADAHGLSGPGFYSCPPAGEGDGQAGVAKARLDETVERYKAAFVHMHNAQQVFTSLVETTELTACSAGSPPACT
jgi:Ras family